MPQMKLVPCKGQVVVAPLCVLTRPSLFYDILDHIDNHPLLIRDILAGICRGAVSPNIVIIVLYHVINFLHDNQICQPL